MRVCTDATLFGAMAPVKGGEKALDIGAGTGLLALMLAQLGAGDITAVEITQEAFEEARLNFADSPWPERLHAVHQEIQGFARESRERYQLIISNPPFFDNHSKSPAALRSTARHTDRLPFTDLIAAVDTLLAEDGIFYLLLPVHAVVRFARLASGAGLYLSRRTDYRGYAHNEAKVSALTFTRSPGDVQTRLLTIYSAHRVYSKESEAYLSPFLLRFAGTGS